MSRPLTSVYAPWVLVRYNNEVCLAYMTRYFGGGIMFTGSSGGRGYLSDDDGNIDTITEIVFNQGQIIRDWRNKPAVERINQWRATEA